MVISGTTGIRGIDSVADSHLGENVVLLRSLVDELASRDPNIIKILQHDQRSNDVGRRYDLKEGFEELLHGYTVPKSDSLMFYDTSHHNPYYQPFNYYPGPIHETDYWSKFAGEQKSTP